MTNRRLLDPNPLPAHSAPDGATVFAVDPLDNAVDHPHEEQREELRAVDMADAFLDANAPVIAPIIASINPPYASPNWATTINIVGSGFSMDAVVLIDGVEALASTKDMEPMRVVSPTLITQPVNLPAADYAISVRNPDGQESNVFTLPVVGPTLDSLTPDTASLAAGNTFVTVVGSAFKNDYLYIGTQWYPLNNPRPGYGTVSVDADVLGAGTFEAYISVANRTSLSNILPFTVTA